MVPPVLVDVDSDGHMDILVTSSSGTISLVDGDSLHLRWTHSLVGVETYR